MKPNIQKRIVDAGLTLGTLLTTFAISIALQNVFHIWEHITTLFVFAVFIITLFTDGYLYGIVAAFAAVIAINYGFTYPYFNVDFSAPVSVVTCVKLIVLDSQTMGR